MLFGISLTQLVSTVGILGIMALIFAESGLLIGFFLPGDTLLFTAGFLATKNILGLGVPFVALLLFVAAVAGDSVGYFFGHKVGPRIFKKEDSILFHKDNLLRAENFYKRFGPLTIVLARFIPIVRTFAPIVAGVGRMKYRTFLTFNLIGGFLWAVGITYLGYFAGAFFESRGINIDNFILPIVGLAMLVSLLSPVLHILRNADSRELFRKKLTSLVNRNKN